MMMERTSMTGLAEGHHGRQAVLSKKVGYQSFARLKRECFVYFGHGCAS